MPNMSSKFFSHKKKATFICQIFEKNIIFSNNLYPEYVPLFRAFRRISPILLHLSIKYIFNYLLKKYFFVSYLQNNYNKFLFFRQENFNSFFLHQTTAKRAGRFFKLSCPIYYRSMILMDSIPTLPPLTTSISLNSSFISLTTASFFVAVCTNSSKRLSRP